MFKKLLSGCSHRKNSTGLCSEDSCRNSLSLVPFPDVDIFTPKVELYTAEEESGSGDEVLREEVEEFDEEEVDDILAGMLPVPCKRGRKSTEESLGLRDTICVLCSKIFTKEYLSVHMATVHEKRREYTCPQCGKDFGQKTSLNNHVRTVHQKIRDYMCVICRKGVGQRTTLANHIKNVHEKRKDLICDFCDRSFGQKTTLNNHIKSIHEKIKAFGCVYCLKTFGQKANLTTHIRNVHNK
ncbi:uncharacterized protein [Lepeophtheirus salmonis]|uniref:uncharacterized protein n=1 Tax=Lepeophtheirus salmonis TaxID=72036 RepID=UPI001AE6CC25|nr:gastrula zinc finger protein XlCGF7.1-like [Lepeophtheirus salmonis]